MDPHRYNRIAVILKEYNINQKEFAELLGDSQYKTKDKISRWCNNLSQPHIAELHKIAKVFRINIQLLLSPTAWENETGPSPVELLKAKKEKENLKSAARKKKKTISKPRKSS